MSEIKDAIKIRGDVKVELFAPDGALKETREIHNLVVDTGLAFIISRMAGTSKAVMSYMALGAGTTAAAGGQTDLISVLGSRVALDSSTIGGSGKQITYVATFGAGAGTGAVTEAGVFNAASAGDMLCRVVFPVVNKQSADSMVITWILTQAAA